MANCAPTRIGIGVPRKQVPTATDRRGLSLSTLSRVTLIVQSLESSHCAPLPCLLEL